jgi:hypothetical protein
MPRVLVLLLPAVALSRLLQLRGYEVGSGNLLAPQGRGKRTLDATWGEALELWGQSQRFTATYNTEQDAMMIAELRLSGTLPSPRQGVGLSYDIAHRPRVGQWAYKLHARLLGGRVTAATPFVPAGGPALVCGAPSITELELGHAFGPMVVRSTLLCREGQLQLDAATELAGGHRLTADVEVPIGPQRWPVLQAELGYSAQLYAGRRLCATVTNRQRATVELLDARSEPGALWIVGTSFPLDGRAIDAPRKHVALTLRRRWGTR